MRKSGEWKKTLSLMLAVFMLLIDLPLTARADTVSDGDTEQYEMAADTLTLMDAADTKRGTLGKSGGLSWIYDSDSKTLTVSGGDELCGSKKAGTDVYESPFAPVFAKYSVEKISFEDCVLTGSAAYLFYSLTDIKSIDLSGLDTSAVTDMSYMFYYCRNITALDLSHLNTGSVKNMESAFCGCSTLKSLNISTLNTAAVTNMESMFASCSSLTELVIGKVNTGAVTNMKNLFSGCRALTTLDVSGLNTGSVLDMSGMFNGCRGLKTLSVGNFNTEKVTNMSGMFNGCIALTGIDLGKFKTGAVTDMSSMFYDCKALTALDLSGFDTAKVTTLAGMFCNCGSLADLKINKFNTAAVTDMSSMFSKCAALKSLDVSSFNTGAVTTMLDMFSGCSALTALDLSSFNTGAVTTMQGLFNGCAGIVSLDLSSFNTAAVTSTQSMFKDCSGLTSLNISGFQTGAVTTMQEMFSGCKSLTALDVSKFDTGANTNMYAMFSGCSSLTALDVSGFNTAAVVNMADAFYNCETLTVLDVSKFNTGAVQDMSRLFYGCKNIAALDVSGFNTAAVTKMGGMFEHCKSVAHLDVSKFETGAVRDMKNMFSECLSLTSIDVSGFNTAAVTDFSGMFGSCKALSTLDLSSFSTESGRTMLGMFSGCTDLNYIKVPKQMGELTAELPYTYYDENDAEHTVMSAANEGKTIMIVHQTKMYVVQFDGNGADSGKMLDQYLEIGTPKHLTPCAFVKKGFTFMGWNTMTNGSGKAYKDRDSVTDISSEAGQRVILYALWKPNKYNIVFNGNGGTGDMKSLDKCDYAVRYELPLNKYKNTGYAFAGWNTAADGSGSHYQNLACVKNLSDVDKDTVTLYAQWVQGAYSITYYLSGGDNNTANPDYYMESSGGVTLQDPTREGYVFKNWCSDSKLKKKITGIAAGSKGDKKVYAKWTANKYTINFEGNGADRGRMPSMTNCAYGKKINLKANLFMKSGFSFAGWNTKEDGSGVGYKNKEAVKNLTPEANGSVTLYAQWERTKYAIVYKLNKGKNGENPEYYNVTSYTITLKDPSKTGHTFLGWFSDAKYKKPATEIPTGSTGKRTFYAKWKANKYTVQFDGNGASGSMPDMKCTYGKRFSLKPNQFRNGSRTFAGWNTKADGTGKSYKDRESVNKLTTEADGVFVLYAQWK